MNMAFFEWMLEAFQFLGIHVSSFYRMDEKLDEIDLGLRRQMKLNFDYKKMLQSLNEHMENDILYLLEDELGMHYSAFRFPEETAQLCRCRLLLVGPVLFKPIERQPFQQLMNEQQIPPDFRPDFLEFFNRLPVIPEAELYHRLLQFFLSRLTGSSPRIIHTFPGMAGWLPAAALSFPRTAFEPEVALHIIEERYQAEAALLEAVAAGNTDEAADLSQQVLKFRLAPRSASAIRDRNNILDTFNTLLRKAAQQGGVHPLHIDKLSRQFAIQIESAFTLEQLNAMNSVMVRSYCLLVRNHSHKQYSGLVQSCMNIIEFYYVKELSLSELAKRCSISENHLSTTFRRETGMTVTDYINQTRIKQALILLNTTSLPIGEIASRCGFFDANYFSRIFKRLQGRTPREYRAMIRRNERGLRGTDS